VPLAANDFEDLIDSMGLAGTAASNLDEILRRLSAATLAEEAAMRVAAGTGQTVAQVKAALAAANKAAEDAARTAAAAERALAAEQVAAARMAADAARATAAAEKALAAEMRASAAAAEEAAAASRKLTADRAAQQAAADQAMMAENLNRMKVVDNAAAAEEKRIADLQKANLAGHDQTAEATAGLQKQADAAQETSRWFSNLTATGNGSAETVAALREKFEALAPAIATAVVILTAYAAALWSLAKAAVGFTQEKDALRATFDVFTSGGGDTLLAGLEDLASQLPYTADRLNAWAKSMASAVGTGEELKTAIRAVAAAEAIMGKSGASAAEGLIKRFAMMAETGQKVKLDRRILSQLAEAGVSVKALAAALGVAPDKLGQMSIAADKLGAAMQKALIQNGAKSLAVMGNSWASISAKLSEGWDDAFEDLGDIVGPFMAQLRSLASEFFAGGAASKGLGGVVRGVLTPAFEIATRTVRAMHIAYLNMLIAFLQARIFFAPVIDAFNKIGVAGGVVNVAMYLIAGTAIVLAVVFGVLALAAVLIALPFIIFAATVYGVVRAVQYLIGVFSGAIANFDNLKNKVSETGSSIVATIASTLGGVGVLLANLPLIAVQAGANFVIGLVQAITTGQGPVADAVKALARAAIGAITGAFQTKSPSRVTSKIGGYFTQGLTGGIDDGTDDVADAAQGAGDAAIGGLGKGMRKGGKAGSKGDGAGGRTFSPTFNNCNFGSMSMQEWRDMMAQWWEELNASGPEPEEAAT
jgi:hypothetical protein